MTMTNAASSSSNNNNNSVNDKASLSSAVSSLVRAQYGLNTNKTTSSSTTDLDKHVAELLLQEARDRDARSKASNSVNSWTFSDEEDGSGKTYTSRTNKRFLKNMLKGVEEHNAPLRRKEERKESLDEIRKRDREARERRTGIKDLERAHHKASASSGPATAIATAAAIATAGSASTTSNGQDKATRRTAPPPGFAARTLAMGLSGAVAARQTQHREERDKNAAVIDARRRAGESTDHRDAEGYHRETSRETNSSRHRALDKGKERQRYNDDDGSGEEGESRRRKRDGSRTGDGGNRYLHRSSRAGEREEHESSGETNHRRRRERGNDRERSSRRSRSPDHVKSDKMDGEAVHSRIDEHVSRSANNRERRDRSEREQSRSYDEEDTSKKRPRRGRRSASSDDDTRSLSDHASEASSDTFVDYTGAADTAPPVLAGSSKMDKYFSQGYNPALDISIADLEDPKTGLIGEVNFSEWDKMLHTLQERREDKTFGVTKAREEERERLLRTKEKRRRRDEREIRHALRKEEKKGKHKKKKHRRHDSDRESGSSGSDCSVGPKPKRKSHKHETSASDTVVIDGFEYGKRGAVRAWDLGK